MKTVYIPKGETVCYESLVTERVIVEGCLKITYGVNAKDICGHGVICAGTIEADTVCISSAEASSVICKRLIAKRVQVPEIFASESAAVSCFLSAAYVETGKLTVSISEIDEVKAQEVINLMPRKRSLFRTLLASSLRSFWTRLTMRQSKPEVMDAAFVPAAEDISSDAPEEPSEQKPASILEMPAVQQKAEDPEPEDFELKRIITLFKLSREHGYTLKLIPGSPEENAPVFDFDTGHISRPAA